MTTIPRTLFQVLQQGGLTTEIERHAGGNRGGAPGKPVVVEKGITAYHASPHDFDKFDMSKLRTGQGANSYGQGLYLAENPKVMESYFREFSGRKPAVYEGRAVVAGSPHTPSEQNAIQHLIAYRKPGESIKTAIDRRISEIERVVEADRGTRQVVSHPDFYPNLIRDLKSLDPNKLQLPTPHRYKVRVGAEKEEFLDYDKPLMHQSQRVKDVIDRGFIKGQPHMEEADRHGFLGKMTGQAFYEGLGPKASRDLRESGIPGMRYLDRFSRSKNEGTHNIVAFRDDILSILKKYGLAGLTAAGAASAGGDAEAGGYKPKSIADRNKPLPQEEEARKALGAELKGKVLGALIEQQLAKLTEGRPASGRPSIDQPMGDVPVPIQDIGAERPRY